MTPNRIGKGLLALFAAATFSGVTAAAALEQAGAKDAVWLGSATSIEQFREDRGSPKIDIPHQVRALAVDDRSLLLWAYGDQTLSVYDFEGNPGYQVSFVVPEAASSISAAQLGCQAPVSSSRTAAAMAVDSVQGDVWISDNNKLVRLSSAGRLLMAKQLPQAVSALSFDTSTSTLWVATCGVVAQFDRAGEVVSKPTPISKGSYISAVEVDSKQGLVWSADGEKIGLMTPEGGHLLQVPLAAKLLSHGKPGTVWAAGDNGLVRLSSDGHYATVIAKSDRRSGAIRALAAHPADGSAWAATDTELLHISAAGTVVSYPTTRSDQLDKALAVYSDTIPPDVSIIASNRRITAAAAEAQLNVYYNDIGRGADPRTLQLRLNGKDVTSACRTTAEHAICKLSGPWRPGANEVAGTVSDFAGNVSASSEVVVDYSAGSAGSTAGTQLPSHTVAISPSRNGIARVSAGRGRLAPRSSVTIENLRSADKVSTFADLSGSFNASIKAKNGDEVRTTVRDVAGKTAGSLLKRVGAPPKASAKNAKSLSRSGVTRVTSANAFTVSGSTAVQFAMIEGAVDPVRGAVIRGTVLTRDGAILPGVTVEVRDHPEFGYAVTDTLGEYSLMVNGGGPLVIDIFKDDYISVQRQVDVPWSDYALVPNVTLIQPDTAGAVIAFGPTATAQVVQSSASTDTSGTRTATLLFQPGTTAELVFTNGSTQPITSDTIRVTEFTVGQSGLSAMPGSLPPSSAYTYAADMTGDQQLALGAKTMQFSTPAVLYLSNFLSFPVGTAVPMGNYDPAQASWVPTDNGVIVKILSTTNGMANLDISGSGVAATPAALAAKGITTAEQTKLATLYAIGAQLWRVPVPHFSAHDPNFPSGIPASATPPQTPPPSDAANGGTNNPNCQQGSIIECQNQVLGESVSIQGTSFSLSYRSNRVPGATSVYTATIPLTGASFPASLKRVEVVVKVAGRSYKYSYAAAANQSLPFTWDGTDYAGRVVQGQQFALVELSYIYDGVYRGPGTEIRGFGQYGTTLTVGNARNEFQFTQKYRIALGVFDARLLGLGGWSLSPQHFYDPVGQSLYLGSGQTIRKSKVASGLEVLKSGSTGGLIDQPTDMAVGADGTIYVADKKGIARIAPDGTTSLFMGGGSSEAEGVLATAASGKATALALGRDGVVYFASGNRVRKVAKDGKVYTVAGQTTAGYSGNNGPATLASLENVGGLAVGPEGNLYIASGKTVRLVTPDGYIYAVAGTNVAGYSGDGGQARLAKFYNASWVSVNQFGHIYISDSTNNRVRKITPDGIIQTVAGNGGTNTNPFAGDGGLATATGLVAPGKTAVLNDGSFYFGSINPVAPTVRYVNSKGILSTVAGKAYSGSVQCGSDGGPARETSVGYRFTPVVDMSGRLFAADYGCRRVFTLDGDLPAFAGSQGQSQGNFKIASSDGTYLYTFDGEGRHLTTHDTLTGALRYSFGYDATGWLISITDENGEITLVERDGAGNPTALVAPHGQRTSLVVNADRYLTSITSPGSQNHAFTYFAGGLLKTFTNPRSLTTAFTYDTNSRLATDIGPDGYQSTLARTALSDGYKVTVTSAAGRQKQYQISYPDAVGEVLTNTDAAGIQSSITFNPNGGSVEVSADGTRRTTTKTGDPRFGMQSLVPSAVTLLFPSGLTSTMTSARQATLSDSTNPLSLTQLVETQTLNGKTWQSSYNATTRTFTRTSPLGRVSTLVVDAKGRPVSIQPAGVATQTLAYDSLGRLQDVSQVSNGETRLLHYAYNGQGLLASAQDALSRTVSFGYDSADRPTSQTLPGNRTLAFAFDANDNLTGLTPPGKPQHAFSFTSGDKTDVYTPPVAASIGTRVSDYGYNLDRQQTSLVRPDGQTLTWTYGATTGRLDQFTIPSGNPNAGSYGYSYSATTGQLSGLTAPGGAGLSYTYDGALLKSETLTGTVAGAIAYSYDNNLRQTGLTIAGTAFTYGYDDDGLLTQAGALNLSRNASTGFLTGSSLGSVSSSHGYNGFGEPASDSYQYNSSALYSASYSRDLLGRITDKVETVGGSTKTYHYGYSLEGRLESVTLNGAVVESYGYDGNGNRTSGNGVTASYDDQDRLLSAGTTSYSYGANGELKTRTISGQVQTYSYDALGNLISAQLPGKTINYVVDGRDRRIGRKLNGTLVQGFLYDGQLEPVAELDGSGAVVSRFLYGSKAHVPDYLIKGGVNYRIISDHLGSPRLVVNTTNGSIAQQLDYDAWGNVTLDSNPGFQPFGYAGGIYDQDTKLTRFGARDYDAQAGRWTAKDPIGFNGGDSNVYAYVENNPISYVDSTGLNPALGAAGGFAVAGPPGAVIGGLIGLGAAYYGGQYIGGQIASAMYNRPPGAWPGDVGADEWGRRNDLGAKEGRRRFHDIKRGNRGKPGSKAADSCSVDPSNGDVYDGQGDYIGNLGEGH